MKKLFITTILIFTCSFAFSQSRSELIRENKELTDSVIKLKVQNEEMNKQVVIMSNKLKTILQLLTTGDINYNIMPINYNQMNNQSQQYNSNDYNSGIYNSTNSNDNYNNTNNSNNKYDRNSYKNTNTITKAQKQDKSEGTYNGYQIMTGPRGGKYYINSHGNKTYIRK